MNKSYVSPTKLACLALCCMISTLNLGFHALILSVIVAASFTFSIAIVSNLEKVASNHVRFIIYTLIVSAVMTILKIVFGYVKSLELLAIAQELDYALLACITLSILPIYFMHKESTKDYYLKTISTATIFTLGAIFIGIIIELINSGSFFGVVLFESTASILGSPFMSFIIIAVICVIGTSVENYLVKQRQEQRLLIDKYKVIIREHQLKAYRSRVENNASESTVEGGAK